MDSDTAQTECTGSQTARSVADYYDQLAERYDSVRFGNSYGNYIHGQERRILKRWLAPARNGLVLDLACGTGRMLDQASHGLDASQTMARIAREKHPQKDVRCGLAWELAEFGMKFDAIFCLHLFMHLPQPEIARVIRACFDQLRPGGVLIFDIASAPRRQLTGFRPCGWHAGTALGFREVADMTNNTWRLKAARGILFFPIHRFPMKIRAVLRPFDDFLGMTPLKEFSSYLFFCMLRQG